MSNREHEFAIATSVVSSKPKANSVISKKNYSIKEILIEKLLLAFTVLSSILILFIMAFVMGKSLSVLQANGLGFILEKGWDQHFIEAWLAGGEIKILTFGALPLIAGTVYTTIGALAVAVPLGMGCAIFLVELCPDWLQKPLISIVRLLAAIPSVVYGLVGLMVIVPYIANNFITTEMALDFIHIVALDGTSLLAGIIVLSLMIVPIFIALASDALKAVPRQYKEASLALGVSHWRTILKILIPTARKGIIAGLVLAAGRAMGEAIALSMVTGSVANLPSTSHGFVFFLEPMRTLASTIVDNAEGMGVPAIESALFACATLLLFSCILLSLFSRLILGDLRKGGSSE